MPLTWELRAVPLEPAAVVARGEAARALARRLLLRDDEALGRLTGVVGAGVLALVGEAEALPWADGALYLARDPACPSLLLPTTQAPSAPLPLLERALLARFPHLPPPLLVAPSLGCVLSLGRARTVAREALLAWLEGGA